MDGDGGLLASARPRYAGLRVRPASTILVFSTAESVRRVALRLWLTTVPLAVPAPFSRLPPAYDTGPGRRVNPLEAWAPEGVDLQADRGLPCVPEKLATNAY
jgi:hypothetical protein